VGAIKELSAHLLPSDKLPTAIYEAPAKGYGEGSINASPVFNLQVIKADLRLTDPSMGYTGFSKIANAHLGLFEPDDLSRISGAFVIGRSTAFSYKGKSPDLKQIGRELNVRYVLEGSVQRAGNRCGSTCSSSRRRAERTSGPSASTSPSPMAGVPDE
jgi:hypothetical protein